MTDCLPVDPRLDLPTCHGPKSAVFRSHLLIALAAGLALTSVSASAAGPRRFPEGETQRGNAPWYGADLQGTNTADGEIFDMHDLTAAHRYLPFGSVVRVTNRSNGKSVEVRI